MNTKTLQNPEEWAVETFGAAELGDVRRTDRLIKLASALGENPSVSLPASMRNWGDTHAAYQFLGNPAICHEQIMTPHFADLPRSSRAQSGALDRRHHRGQSLDPQGDHRPWSGRTRQQGKGLLCTQCACCRCLGQATLRLYGAGTLCA